METIQLQQPEFTRQIYLTIMFCHGCCMLFLAQYLFGRKDNKMDKFFLWTGKIIGWILLILFGLSQLLTTFVVIMERIL